LTLNAEAAIIKKYRDYWNPSRFLAVFQCKLQGSRQLDEECAAAQAGPLISLNTGFALGEHLWPHLPA
jgi:hypothetical protein